MALSIFADESGYTGEHQLDAEQSVFVLASINVSDKTTTELLTEHFAGVKAQELKHSRLAKKPKGQQRISNLIRSLASTAAAGGLPTATAFAVHKRFQLLTLLVDLWVEPAMHLDGIDMYEQGQNLAFANMTFCVLGLAPRFMDELLRRFQAMMRERIPREYNAFWDFVYHAYCNPIEISPDREIREMIRNTLVPFLDGQRSLGMRHLMGLPPHSLDVAFSTVLVTAQHWYDRAGQPLRFTLDESKYFAEAEWIWRALTRSDLPEATFLGSGNTRIHFPLEVEATGTASSKQVRQLQFADLVAGATAEFCSSRIQPTLRSAYTAALQDAGILTLGIGGIWPSTDVTPEAMGTVGMSGKFVDYMQAHLKNTTN